MVKRYDIQCAVCGDTDVAHETEDGDMVTVEDLKPLVESLQTLLWWDSQIVRKHNDAIIRLRHLILASAGCNR